MVLTTRITYDSCKDMDHLLTGLRGSHNDLSMNDPTHLEHCAECFEKAQRRELNQLKSIVKEKESHLKYLISRTECYTTALNAPIKDTPVSADTRVTTLDVETQVSTLREHVDKLRDREKTLKYIIQCKLDTRLTENEKRVTDLKTHIDWLRLQAHDTKCALERQNKWGILDYQYLSKQNVWDNLFHIHIESDVGVINSVYLGITDVDNIDFDALNYALGDIVLLLHCLSRLTSFKYYKPMPSGRQSYFVDTSKTKFILYFDKSIWSWRTSINNGLKALVVCMKEIEMRFNLQSLVPGKIDLDKGCISLYSWKFPSNPHDVKQTTCWNKACRYILSNLKIYLHKLTTQVTQ